MNSSNRPKRKSNVKSALDIAFKLHTLGFSVIPSGGGDKGKAPLVNWQGFQGGAPSEQQLQDWQDQLQPHLWGIVTNDHIAVIDADTPEIRAVLEAELGEPHVISPRGGAHWYIDTTSHPLKTTVRLLPDIDVRGVGGFVNIAGGKYQILRLPVPGETLIPYGRLPKRILAALTGSKPAPKPKQGAAIPDTTRNATLTKIAGAMRRQGADQTAIEAALLEVNAAQCQPPLPEREVLAIARSVARYEPQPDTPALFHLTDAGNAEYFCDHYGDILRYDHRRSRWLEWGKHHWQPESDGQIMRLALKATRDRYKAAVGVDGLEERQRIAKWAIGSEQRARLEATIAIAESLKPIADSGDNWDADPWLFCVQNGVIDLKTGQLRPGQQSDRITMQSPVTFDPGAKAPRWLSFQNEIANGNTDLISWKQKYLGYCLTAITHEQIMAIGYGRGANGKGREAAAMRHILGDYAFDAPFTTFELYNRSVIPNDMAALVGKRFVTSSETNEDSRLNESRIKQLSGEDPVTARFLHCEFFTFQPVAKFLFSVNHRPKIQDDSYGFWRKVRLIPYIREFKGEAADKELLGKLIAEASGVLNWLIEGCLRWQSEGLDTTPDCIVSATQEYEADSDPLREYLADRCAINSQAQGASTAFYKDYLAWCDERGLREKEKLTNNAFGRRMGQKFSRKHGEFGAIYFGVGLKTDGFVGTADGFKGQFQFNSTLNPFMSANQNGVENPSFRQENPSVQRQEGVLLVMVVPFRRTTHLTRALNVAVSGHFHRKGNTSARSVDSPTQVPNCTA